MSEIHSTDDNLREVAPRFVALWLVHAALARTDLTYGQARTRLEEEVGFTRIGPAPRLGVTAGSLQQRLYDVDPEAPLLNSLLVRQGDRMPGEGIAAYFAREFDDDEINEQDRDDSPLLWREYSDAAAQRVYEFPDWIKLYEQAFQQKFTAPSGALDPLAPNAGEENDRTSKGGEGEHHENLRMLIYETPELVNRHLAGCRTETEVTLKSADRVDVVCFAPNATWAIEVKSKDSNDVDLERGIYQCVKYRAVLLAMDTRAEADVRAVLVTEKPLPGHLAELARSLKVQRRVVTVN